MLRLWLDLEFEALGFLLFYSGENFFRFGPTQANEFCVKIGNVVIVLPAFDPLRAGCRCR